LIWDKYYEKRPDPILWKDAGTNLISSFLVNIMIKFVLDKTAIDDINIEK